jgi:hypothetical protein
VRFVSISPGFSPELGRLTSRQAGLAALAQSLDYDLITFDGGFRSFEGLKLQLLTVTDYSDTP